MLVLARRIEQTIRIEVPPSDEPQLIEVKLTRLGEDKAWFGFEADRSVLITRGELTPRMERIEKAGTGAG